jgi:hypothetical protein
MARMRIAPVALLILLSWPAAAFAQCAPAPDSPYFFRNLSQQRAQAKISVDRHFYEQLLSATFAIKGPDGKVIPREAFIDGELAATHGAHQQRYFSIRNFRLLEHRRGFVVANYLLTEGTKGGGETHASQFWLREIYKVEDGKWRLAAIEPTAPQPARGTN